MSGRAGLPPPGGLTFPLTGANFTPPPEGGPLTCPLTLAKPDSDPFFESFLTLFDPFFDIFSAFLLFLVQLRRALWGRFWPFFRFFWYFWGFFGHPRHFFGHFWTIFGHFWVIFGPFLDHFLTPEKSFF